MNIKVAAFIVSEKSSNTLAPPPGVQGRGQKLSRTWGFTILFVSTVILLPAHPASFAHKFLFQRVPVSPEMQ